MDIFKVYPLGDSIATKVSHFVKTERKSLVHLQQLVIIGWETVVKTCTFFYYHSKSALPEMPCILLQSPL